MVVRRLAEASDREEARRIVDALLVAGIEAEAHSDAGTEIWVFDAEDLEPARQKLEVFRREGVPDAAAAAKEIRSRERRDREDHVQRVHDLRDRWFGSSHAPGIVTIFLIVASVAVGLVDLVGEPEAGRMWNLTIDHWESVEPLARVREGEVWRLVTPIFLHFGIFHLGFNMLWTWSLGNQVEHNHGSLALLALVLVSALAGNLGQYAVSGPSFGGMSGVVYALFGFKWMNARFNRGYAYSIDGTTTVFIMLWFVACATGMFGPIANVGHGAGLVVGLIAGLPSYIRHLQAKADIPSFESGGWADVHLVGFRRFRRRFVTPYVPLWFLALAGVVIAIEPGRGDEPLADLPVACQRAYERLEHCGDTLSLEEYAAFVEQLERAQRQVVEKTAHGDLAGYCRDTLARLEEVARQHGCLDG
jgi:GlpG protein